MSSQTIFFYGLFMDPEILQAQGALPSQPTVTKLENYKLYLGKRATLIPSDGDHVFGTVMRLTQPEVDTLYSTASVREYQAVQVTCQFAEDDYIEAITYILPEGSPLTPPLNADYAHQLQEVCQKMKLPSHYQKKIAEFILKIETAENN